MITVPDYNLLSRTAAEHIAKIGIQAERNRGRFDLVLSGGDTPRKAYELLTMILRRETALCNVTHFWWGDERVVTPQSFQSNYYMAHLALLGHLTIAPDRIHRIPAYGGNLDKVARDYETQFPAKPDLLLLGMGADGHTASLFAHSPALDQKTRRFVASRAPVEPNQRITIAPPGIHCARAILVLVSGPMKAAALARVFAEEGDFHEAPARLVRDAVWIVDEGAAKGPRKAGPA